MPKESSCKRNITELYGLIKYSFEEYVGSVIIGLSQDFIIETEYDIALLHEMLTVIEGQRYLGYRTNVKKSRDFTLKLFWNYDPVNFKKISRMSKETFQYVLGLIENDTIFQNNSNHSQNPVWQQLEWNG